MRCRCRHHDRLPLKSDGEKASLKPTNLEQPGEATSQKTVDQPFVNVVMSRMLISLWAIQVCPARDETCWYQKGTLCSRGSGVTNATFDSRRARMSFIIVDMEANRESASELRQRSRDAARMGDLAEAVRLMERAVRLFPVTPLFCTNCREMG